MALDEEKADTDVCSITTTGSLSGHYCDSAAGSAKQTSSILIEFHDQPYCPRAAPLRQGRATHKDPGIPLVTRTKVLCVYGLRGSRQFIEGFDFTGVELAESSMGGVVSTEGLRMHRV